MKKGIITVLMALFLAGCGAQETLETLGDSYTPELVPARQVLLTLPQDAAVQTVTGAEGKLYLCDGYVLTVQTLSGGDLSKTVQSVTGFLPEKLSLIETERGGIRRYDCVWACAGEGGDQVGRAAILDDGAYHYVVTFMADSRLAGELSRSWQAVLDSVQLSTG